LYLTKTTVRTRFAPSPTGHLHIGNARTAIMNWLFARHAGGRYIVRIEDTDRERSNQEAETAILKDLTWLGLNWDEGPAEGGEYGPYRQSERWEVYRDHVRKLQKDGRVYSCYCTPDELEIRRRSRLALGQSAVYDGLCRNLTSDQMQKKEAEGHIPSLRFRVDETEIQFEDLVKGRINVQSQNIGDFILLRPDGMPMYNFACVVDDHLMEISHVIRGDDHVSNTPRQILLYRAFGWQPPVFVHIPMILGEDRVRLSKRHGATSVEEYREQGYLPEALINFLSLLSWSSESGDEILSVNRLIEEFDFDRISKSAAVFNVEKLKWMNGVYIRNLDLDRLTELALPILQEGGLPVSNADEARPIANLLQEKLEQLTEFREKARIFFQQKVTPENKEAEETDSWTEINKDSFHILMRTIQKKTGVKGKNLWMPIRVALTGQKQGPDLSGMVEFFGLMKCRRFIEEAIRR
jgi:nondiscriminating glutamyl-tRNA synthetase